MLTDQKNILTELKSKINSIEIAQFNIKERLINCSKCTTSSFNNVLVYGYEISKNAFKQTVSEINYFQNYCQKQFNTKN